MVQWFIKMARPTEISPIITAHMICRGSRDLTVLSAYGSVRLPLVFFGDDMTMVLPLRY
jgi:hypothetical protein